MKILFVCLANRRRSRCAFELFKDEPNVEVKSCGIVEDYVNETIEKFWPDATHFSVDLFNWADKIYALDLYAYSKLRNIAAVYNLDFTKIINMHIEDNYEHNDTTLQKLLLDNIKF